LQAIALGVNGHLNTCRVRRRGLIRVLTRIITPRRELLARWALELERLAIGSNESISDGVESQIAGECESGNDIRGCNECMCGGIGVVAAGEVTIVRSDDCILRQ
jgi:hypothetical protein